MGCRNGLEVKSTNRSWKVWVPAPALGGTHWPVSNSRESDAFQLQDTALTCIYIIKKIQIKSLFLKKKL